MNVREEGEVKIGTESDIASARRAVREVALKVGFGITDTARIVATASELSRNTHKYGGGGMMRWRMLADGSTTGVELEFEDHGPGIPNIGDAMRDGFTTGGGMGIGLPGSKRLMDEMTMESRVGEGTTVTVRKWRR